MIHDLGGDPINGSAPGDDVDQPNWPFKLFFQAPVLTASGETYYQNFFTSPAAALEHGVLWVAFGAGERDDLPYVGNASIDENNRFDVVKDASIPTSARRRRCRRSTRATAPMRAPPRI